MAVLAPKTNVLLSHNSYVDSPIQTGLILQGDMANKIVPPPFHVTFNSGGLSMIFNIGII